MDNMTLTLTTDEKNALLQLLDGAAKFYGIQASKAVAHFVDKLSATQEAVVEKDSLNG